MRFAVKRVKKKLKKPLHKTVALTIVFSLLFQLGFPTSAWALTGGPSQPEVQSFEPVSTSDMVDPFSGGFTYNIPLLNVDGYPINISYHGGVTMDQEASWVGLGWNINPGVINRNVRGIPDDFKGDIIEHDYHMKDNSTYGIKIGAGLEIFGTEKGDKIALGLSSSLGVHYNNYNGVGADFALNLSLAAGPAGKSPLTGDLGIDASSDDGLTISPSIGLSAQIADGTNSELNMGLHVGTAFNSRQGLQTLTISGSVSQSEKYSTVNKDNEATGSKSESEAITSPKASFNLMMPTYTPQITMSMSNLSITGNFKLGFENWGLHPNFTLGGYYTDQTLAQTVVQDPAYGYMNADQGVGVSNAVMDFNREKDGPFTQTTPDLPLANFTYDILSVSGQGIGGSYRPFRSDIGHVFDPYNVTTSSGYSIGAEVGIGNLWHAGVDFTANSVSSYSGDWLDDNLSASGLSYKSAVPGDPLYEPVYFKEANEKSIDSDPSFFDKVGDFDPQRVNLDQIADFYTVGSTTYASGLPVTTANYRKNRDIRNQSISFLNHGQLQNFGLEDPSTLNLFSGAPDHHIAEITSLGTDGKRYVYGIAAYNTKKEEVTFDVGQDVNGNGGHTASTTGLVAYTPGVDNSTGNKLGVDEYYSNTITPPYAHSYLLTAVLSPDYVDADGVRGPSAGDLGTYTKFNYAKRPTFKWRVPVGADSATFNEGLKYNPHDDKGNYLYGEKELWYLQSIETKNYIAVFTTAAREDGLGVLDENGAVDSDTSHGPRLLSKISLYTIPNYNAHIANSSIALNPIEEVHFVYDYSLCPGVPNNALNIGSTTPTAGKLTLKKIYFTYQNSFKGELSPYQFTYCYNNPALYNPSYNIKAYDRWGFYKPDLSTSNAALGSPASPAEYPYVEQNKTQQDQYAAAWTLTDIGLPSGGGIHVDFESNDYAYVQNKQAMQMFRIEGASSTVSGSSIGTPNTLQSLGDAPNLLLTGNYNYQMAFPLQKDANGNYITDMTKYFNGIGYLYFRFLMQITPGNPNNNFNPNCFEYVSGYAPIDSYGLISGAPGYGWVKLSGVQINADGSGSFSPIVKSTIQFARTTTPRLVFNEPPVTGGMDFKSAFEALVSSFSQFGTIGNLNGSIFSQGYCYQFVIDKSFIRLDNPNSQKLGGGARVKDIMSEDEWSGMTNGSERSFDYGQQYSYTLADGVTSSGVACYEPQLGGDENPWKQPVFYGSNALLVPDDKHYMEEPFGESFFPSPSVGYSIVTVKNLQRKGVHRDATGTVVHEFYTSKDFPTITSRTDLQEIEEKTDPLSLTSLFDLGPTLDYMTASEGYTIELNDMNGKPEAQYVYQEDQTEPISSVNYYYQRAPLTSVELTFPNGPFAPPVPKVVDVAGYRVDNSVTTINKDGSIGKANIGVFFDDVADFRQSETDNNSAAVMANVDFFLIPGPLPMLIPTLLPSYTSETTRFRSNVTTKVIQRFGILDSTVVTDLGSTVKTQNLAYDAQSGEVLLTKTANDFNDSIFNLTYPAYWHYDGMGPAYENIGLSIPSVVFASGTGMATIPNASGLFSMGDELALTNGSSGQKAWVVQVKGNTITAEIKDGSKVGGTYNLEIVRSGRRNMQTMDMAKITSLVNPINSLQSNSYQKVTQASSKEFADYWRTYCNCFEQSGMASDNPYILGVLGNYRLKTSLLYLTPRDQSSFDDNTNVRKDGTFNSYNPFYSNQSGYWVITPDNWTYTSQVTDFNPYGQEIEDQDALGRYSSATFGYNQTLPTSVAANAQYKEQGFDGFEDYAFNGCADNHLDVDRSILTLDTTQSHTGLYSLLIGSTPVVIGGQISICTPNNPCNISMCTTYLSNHFTPGGTYTIHANGGTAPYTFAYNITNGSVPVYMGLNGGISLPTFGTTNATIVVSVTDANGCTQKKTVSIVNGFISGIPSCPACSISCCFTTTRDANLYNVYLTPTTGTAPYNYIYTLTSGGSGLTISQSGNNLDLSQVNANNFTVNVTITDANGCTFQATISATYDDNGDIVITGINPC